VEKKTAVAVGVGLLLMVAGAMSAFAMTIQARTSTGGGAGSEAQPVVVTEYVDEAGNPLAGPGDVTVPDPQLVMVELGGNATETIVVRSAQGTFTSDTGFGVSASVGGPSDVWVDDDDEGQVWDDDDDDEDEDHEDEDEDHEDEDHEDEDHDDEDHEDEDDDD
jgi:hypothetical protein